MKISVFNFNAEQIEQYDFDQSKILVQPNKQVMFEQIICENAAMHQGTHSTLTKAEVRGGGRKPRPQKHTGRARQGSIRNPHWVGGGVAFGPKPNRNYHLYLNRQANILALKSALSQKINNNLLYLLCDEKFPKCSTKTIVNLLKKMQLSKRCLIVSDNPNIIHSTTNIPNVVGRSVKNVSVKDLVNANNLIVQKNCLAALERKVRE